MKTVVPDYYKEFTCLADKCVHNCCIGWEIDVDDETYKLYENTDSCLSVKLKNNIVENNGCYCFKLTDDERCPFLNEDNLCDIIINMGEDALCGICSDHPRFKNYFTNRVEIGLGLCCEGAGYLILSNESKTRFLCDDDCCDTEEERVFLNLRQKIFNVVQNRELTIAKRVEKLCSMFDFNTDIDNKALCDFLFSLERLDCKWDDILSVYKNSDCRSSFHINDRKWQIVYEQLLIYFLYRHLSESIYDCRFIERLKFCIISSNIIFSLCEIKYRDENKIDISDCVEFARMYSSEIEYSEDNTEKFLEFLA